MSSSITNTPDNSVEVWKRDRLNITYIETKTIMFAFLNLASVWSHSMKDHIFMGFTVFSSFFEGVDRNLRFQVISLLQESLETQ